MKKLPLPLPDHLTLLEGHQNASSVLSLGKKGAPPIPPALAYILEEVRRELAGQHASTSTNADRTPLKDCYGEIIDSVATRLGFNLASYERDQIAASLESEAKPFGVLQDLIDDPVVSDIIVTDYSTISAQHGQRTCSTDVSFTSNGAYEAFVERLLLRAGSSYSTKTPVADGMIGDGVRLHAVHKCLCSTGPYLTLRINRFSSVTIEDLVDLAFAPPQIMSYLCRIVRAGHTVLIVGEVGTGKTTLARALAASIPVTESILVIEDTPEIRLEHPHVRYITTRDENSDGAGRIAPAACIRAGMRMAMNRIIFGEMRDSEAAEAFVDVCASGHPGLSTIHARSATEALTRLELFLGRAQKGVGRSVIHKQISTAVQVVVHLSVCSRSGKRRIFEITEVGAAADDCLRRREMFRYTPEKKLPAWSLQNRVSFYRQALESSAITDLPAVNLSSLQPILHLSPCDTIEPQNCV